MQIYSFSTSKAIFSLFFIFCLIGLLFSLLAVASASEDVGDEILSMDVEDVQTPLDLEVPDDENSVLSEAPESFDNLDEKINDPQQSENITLEKSYAYEDGDGTIHFFYKDRKDHIYDFK